MIGKTFLPLAHEGEALFHIARYDDETDSVFGAVEAFHEHFEPDATIERVSDPIDEFALN